MPIARRLLWSAARLISPPGAGPAAPAHKRAALPLFGSTPRSVLFGPSSFALALNRGFICKQRELPCALGRCGSGARAPVSMGCVQCLARPPSLSACVSAAIADQWWLQAAAADSAAYTSGTASLGYSVYVIILWPGPSKKVDRKYRKQRMLGFWEEQCKVWNWVLFLSVVCVLFRKINCVVILFWSGKVPLTFWI